MNDDLISRSALLREIGTARYYSIDPYNQRGAIFKMVATALPVDAEPVRHGSWKHTQKHLWHKDMNGEIDMWYVDHGYHNGPGCEICGRSFCEHCDPNWAEDECNIGYYVCSECDCQTKAGDSNYCPNCGAKMDGEENAAD